MAITANFRPAQMGQFQTGYTPFPFEDIAPIAMRMQQEYTAGVGVAGELESFVGGLPMSKKATKSGMGEQKMAEAKEKVRGVLQKTPDARSPEFHMNLRKVESDIKNDPFWKITAANAAKEPAWENAINDPNITDANKWDLMTKYAGYQASDESEVLGDPTTAEYVDYNARLEIMAEDYTPTGWQKSLETGEFKQSGGRKGIDPARVASGLGLTLIGNKLGFGTIPAWFAGTAEGAQLDRDARYQYDMIRAQDPETEHTLESVKNAIYYDTAAKLVEKYSGYVTSEAEGLVDGADVYTGLDFSSYMDEHASLLGTPQARKAANAYKKSGIMALWGKMKDLPGLDTATNRAEEFLAQAKEGNIPLDEIRKQLDIYADELGEEIGMASISAGISMGPSAGKKVADALLVPITYAIQDNAPALHQLSNDERNSMWKTIKSDPNLEAQFDEEGLTNELWQKMQDNATEFFEQGVFVDVGIPVSNASKEAKHVRQTTERLFGIGADDGKIKLSGGTIAGKLAQHILIDKSSGEMLKIEDLDLPEDKDINVQYKGILDARNPYGPQTIAVHIHGKDYYVMGQNPTAQQYIANSLNSYQFTYNGIGAEFTTNKDDAQGNPIKVTPSFNYNTNQYEITTGDDLTYMSDDSIEDAYLQFDK